MTIRTFEAGDDAAQVSIYNEAAADLPKFKPATLDEVRRRLRGKDFDPAARFFALANGRPMGYVTFQRNGRVSYPWCRKGFEILADRLFQHALEAMKQRGLTRAFAACRGDWPTVGDFFRRHGFEQKREMINYVLDLVDMPTPAARPGIPITAVTPEDLPALLNLVPNVLRVRTVTELEQYLLHNPYFPPDAAFVLRARGQAAGVAALGIVVANPGYANPKQVDSAMPCFRLGAFGTEDQQTKRINGLFSVLIPEGRDMNPQGLNLLGHAAFRLADTDVESVGAQVPSDVPHLARFYKQYFRKQGSFPIYERELT
jgi:hypothetical protein